MTTRYKILPNFPQHVINAVVNKYNKEIGNKVDDYPNQLPTAVSNLKVIQVLMDIDLPEFKPAVLFLISKPNSGLGIPHIDRSRNFSLNIPIQVNPDKGHYIAGRFELLSDYPDPKPRMFGGEITQTYDYDEKYFEKVRMEHPIFINTGLPHSWINDDDQHRVIVNLFLKTKDFEEASRIVDQWV